MDDGIAKFLLQNPVALQSFQIRKEGRKEVMKVALATATVDGGMTVLGKACLTSQS